MRAPQAHAPRRAGARCRCSHPQPGRTPIAAIGGHCTVLRGELGWQTHRDRATRWATMFACLKPSTDGKTKVALLAAAISPRSGVGTVAGPYRATAPAAMSRCARPAGPPWATTHERLGHHGVALQPRNPGTRHPQAVFNLIERGQAVPLGELGEPSGPSRTRSQSSIATTSTMTSAGRRPALRAEPEGGRPREPGTVRPRRPCPWVNRLLPPNRWAPIPVPMVGLLDARRWLGESWLSGAHSKCSPDSAGPAVCESETRPR